MVKQISSEELDHLFDEGQEEVLHYFDTEHPIRPHCDPKRVNVDFPAWMVDELDREARRIGVGRQAIIKTWIAERLDKNAQRSA